MLVQQVNARPFFHLFSFQDWKSITYDKHWKEILKEGKDQWKVDRELANHSLSSTASQGTSDIPFPWFLMLGCNSQAQDLRSHGGCRIIGPKVEDY